MTEPWTEAERRRVRDRAIELATQEEARRYRAGEDAAMRRALGELGVRDEDLDQAALEIRAADQAAEAARIAQAERRARTLRAGMAVTLATAVLGSLALALWPSPPPPFVDGFDSPAGWSLDINPGTRATLSWPTEGARGAVATLQVEQFVLDAEGHFITNFDGAHLPARPGDYHNLSFDVRGSLPKVRVYLEAGDQRWRSPPVDVGADWSRVSLDFSSFERQARTLDGSWKVTGPATPTGLTDLSFKVGWYVNEPTATGQIQLDDVRWE